jgi:hypothetical protein
MLGSLQMSKRDETVDTAEDLVFMNKRPAICEVAYMLGIVMVRILADFQTMHFTKASSGSTIAGIAVHIPRRLKETIHLIRREVLQKKKFSLQTMQPHK